MTFGVIASFALLFGGIAILAIGFIRGGKEKKKKSKGVYARVMNQPASKTSLEKSIPSAKASTKLRTNNSSNSTNDISNPAHPLNPANPISPLNPIHVSAYDDGCDKKTSDFSRDDDYSSSCSFDDSYSSSSSSSSYFSDSSSSCDSGVSSD